MKTLACALGFALAPPPGPDQCEDIRANPPAARDEILTFNGPDVCETCKEAVALEVGKDGLRNEGARLAEATVVTTQGCNQSGVLCFTPQGTALLPDEVPTRLRPGDELTVKVVGCEVLQDGVEFEIDAKHIASADRLFRADFTTKAAAEGRVQAEQVTDQCEEARLCLDSASIAVLHETKITVPSDDSLQRVEVVFESDVAKATYKNLSSAKESVSIPVVQGRYFIDLGILVPFVIEGRRRVITEQGPGAGTRVSSIDQDVPKPTPAVMLNVFPGGRRLGIFHSFGERQRCNVKATYFDCKRHDHARNAANSLGFQVGLDLDFTDPADAFFAGGIFEPVTGLSFNAGVSVRKGEFLAAGRHVGQLVVDDTDVEPGTRYMARPYVGVTFSLDIIRTLIAFRARAREVDTGDR